MKQEEKLEEAKRLYQTANADQRYVLESLFPELAESKDEKIRKALIDLIKSKEEDGYMVINNFSTGSILAWLEKQAPKPKWSEGDDAYKLFAISAVEDYYNGGATMTAKQRELICTIAGIPEIGELSDGYHTFNSLYKQRMILFAALVRAYKDKAWKSWKHEDGELCFGGGWFIVGIDTPAGSYTYHYEAKDWGRFECIALERAKHWDGHTDADVERLLSL